jgi:DNA-binding MarR family transcriptional regulator
MPAVVSPDDVLRQFRAVSRSVNRHFHAVERRCGISGSQLSTLAVVHAQPGIKVTELAQRLALHQSTASNLIDLLARRGLIERRRNDADLRVVRLHSTEAGRSVVDKAPQPLEGLLFHALRHLTAEPWRPCTASHGRRRCRPCMSPVPTPTISDPDARPEVASRAPIRAGSSRAARHMTRRAMR